MWKIEMGVCLGFLLVLSLFDLKYKQVPSVLLIFFFIIGTCFLPYKKGEIIWKVMGVLPGIIFFGVSKWSEEKIGYGDSIGIFILGLYLGVFHVLSILCTSFFLSGCLGCLKGSGRRKKEAVFPFFPFLFLGACLEWALWVL